MGKKRANRDCKVDNKKTGKTDKCIICGSELVEVNEKLLCGRDSCLNEVSPEELDNEYDEVEDKKAIFLEMIEKIGGVTENEKELERLTNLFLERDVTLDKILSSPYPDEKKVELFHHWILLKGMNQFTPEYRAHDILLKSQLWDFDVDPFHKKMLDSLFRKYAVKEITVNKILESNMPDELCLKMMEDYVRLKNYDENSHEYQRLRKDMWEQLECWNPSYRDSFLELSKMDSLNLSYEQRLFTSGLPLGIKTFIFRELNHFRDMGVDDSEYTKQKHWLEYALSLPTVVKEFPVRISDSLEKKKKFQLDILSRMNKTCYGMPHVKDLLLDYVFQEISNPSGIPQILVLAGPPGIGKTTLSRSLALSLERDFIPINMGGVTDSVKLVGHARGYIGATPGEIVKGLSRASSMNPIIYLDELDKIQTGSSGMNEVEGVLTHLLDPTQNKEFIDDYLGFPIDLSKSLFIITINQIENLNPIIADRVFVVPMNGYTLQDKMKMAKDYLLPTIMTNLGSKIEFEDAAVRHLVNILPEEPGVRALQKSLQFISNRMNRKVMLGEEKSVVTVDKMDEILKTVPKNEKTQTMFI